YSGVQAAMETQVHLISYEESLLMPENKLEEILDGVSRIMPPPTTGHMRFVMRLTGELERVFPDHVVWPAPYGLGIRRNPLRYRIPDISVTGYPFDSADPYRLWCRLCDSDSRIAYRGR